MSENKIKEGFGLIRDGALEALTNLPEAVMDYKKGKPSLWRIVTIPAAAIMFGIGLTGIAIVEEYKELRADFKKAREDQSPESGV